MSYSSASKKDYTDLYRNKYTFMVLGAYFVGDARHVGMWARRVISL